MASVPSWVWIVAGWCAIAWSAWLVVRGRPWWKRRKEPACPACGYSFVGLASLKCPECGRTAKSDRALLRVPGLKRWRLAAVVLLLAGWAGIRTPAMVRHGWAAGVPGWALAAFGPTSGSPGAMVELALRSYGMPLPANLPASPTPVRDALVAEGMRRMDVADFAHWQSELYLKRCLLDRGHHLSIYHNMRRRWAWDRPMVPPRRAPYGLSFAPLKGPSTSVRADVVVTPGSGNIPVLRVTVDAEIDATKGVDTFLAHASTPELDAAVGRALRPRLNSEGDVEFDERNGGDGWAEVTCAVEFKVRVLLDGRVLGHGVCNTRHKAADGIVLTPGMWWEPGGKGTAKAGAERVELEITGDPVAATERELLYWDGPTSVWSGTVRVKPAVSR